jgi:serine/threonine protein kinase
MNALKMRDAVSGRLGESVKREMSEMGGSEGRMEVVKSIPLPTSPLSATWDDRLCSRIQHLCDGNCSGLLKLESIRQTEDKIELVTEFQEMNGDEFMKLKAPLSSDLCISWAFEFIDGLFFMHMNGFIHGNIKPSNFFWSEETNSLSVADFAYAKVPVEVGSLEGKRSSDGSATEKTEEWARLFDFAVAQGPVKYAAPEAGMGLISEKMDVFSFGCLLFEVLSGDDYKKCYTQADESTDQDTSVCPLSHTNSEFQIPSPLDSLYDVYVVYVVYMYV